MPIAHNLLQTQINNEDSLEKKETVEAGIQTENSIIVEKERDPKDRSSDEINAPRIRF